MKITKEQLKQIIMEELERLIEAPQEAKPVSMTREEILIAIGEKLPANFPKASKDQLDTLLTSLKAMDDYDSHTRRF